MKALAAAAALALVPFGATLVLAENAQAQTGTSWEEDPFWTVFVAHARAEMMYRRLNNRFCSFPEDRPGVHGGRRNIRQTLDEAKLSIDSIWPGRMDRTFNAFASRDATPVQRCDDPVAAEEAFAAALMAADSVEFMLEALERDRSAREKD